MQNLPKYNVSKEEALELINKARDGCKDSRDKLVEYNLRLVYSVCMRFKNRGYELDDLFQIGTIGLIKSIDKFDTSFDVQFSTYAVPMIIGEIQRFIRDDGTIKISRSIKEDLYHIKKFQEAFYNENVRQPSIEEIADGLKIPFDDVILSIMSEKEIKSIHQIIFANDGDPITLMDQISVTENGYDKLILIDALNCLDERSKQIINLRYFMDKNQRDVGSMLGVTQVQISRLETAAIRKVRQNLGVTFIPSIPRYKQPKVKKEKRIRDYPKKENKPTQEILKIEGTVIELPKNERKTNLKKQDVFLLFEKGYQKNRIITETGMTSASYYNYKSLFKSHKETLKQNKVEDLAIKREEKIEGAKGVVEYKSTIITVDIILLDDTILKNASIFPNEVKNGDESIQNLDDIDSLFRKVPVSWKGKWINFQTEYINGTINTDNIKDYKVNIKEY